MLPSSLQKQSRERLISDLFTIPAIEDYAVARWAYVNHLNRQFYWSAAQAIEKLLKAILISLEIDTRKHGHNLSKLVESLEIHDRKGLLVRSFSAIKEPNPLVSAAKHPKEFIEQVNKFGSTATRYRLVNISSYFDDILRFDETVFTIVELGQEFSSICNKSFPLTTSYGEIDLSATVKEAITAGNPYFSAPNAKKVVRRMSMAKSPTDISYDGSSLKRDSMEWLRKFAKL